MPSWPSVRPRFARLRKARFESWFCVLRSALTRLAAHAGARSEAGQAAHCWDRRRRCHGDQGRRGRRWRWPRPSTRRSRCSRPCRRASSRSQSQPARQAVQGATSLAVGPCAQCLFLLVCRRKPPPRQLLVSLPWRWTCLRKRSRYATTISFHSVTCCSFLCVLLTSWRASRGRSSLTSLEP